MTPEKTTAHWVAVEDLLPPASENVRLYLVVVRGHFVTIGQWYSEVNAWKTGSVWVTGDVTHWARLPDPPPERKEP